MQLLKKNQECSRIENGGLRFCESNVYLSVKKYVRKCVFFLFFLLILRLEKGRVLSRKEISLGI